MPRYPFSLAATLLLAATAHAEPPIDEDALPEGAIARLGSRVRRPPAIRARAFLDGGETLLTVHEGPELHYCDLETGHLLRVRTLGRRSGRAMSLTPDGRTLAVSDFGSVTVWEVPTGRLIRKIPLIQVDLGGICLTSDGSTLVAVSDERLIAYDLKIGKSREMAEFQRRVGPLTLGLDSRVALAGDDKQLRCWDLASGRGLWSYEGAIVEDGVAVVPGGKLAWITIPRDHFQPGLYDLKTGKRADAQPATPLQPGNFLLGPDAQSVAAHGPGGWALHDLYSGKLKVRLPGLAQPIAFTPDGRGMLGYDDTNFAVQYWDLTTGRTRYKRAEIPGHKYSADHLMFLPGGAGLLSADRRGESLRVWDLEKRRTRCVMDWHYSSFTISPGGEELVELHPKFGLRFRRLDTGAVTRVLPVLTAGFKSVVQLRFGPGGQILWAAAWNTSSPGTDEGRVFLRNWDIETGRMLTSRTEPAPRLIFSLAPDGMMVAVADRGVYETATGRRISTLQEEERLADLCFSRDNGRLILNESWEKKGRQFGALRLREIATSRNIVLLPTDHVEPEVGFQFAPDGRRLVSASTESIQVWDSFTGRELKRWDITDRWGDPEHTSPIARCVAVSSEGKTLATGHDDGTILLWPMPAIPPGPPPTAVERDALWADLAADDASKAWRAIARFADAPADALALLRERLTPTPPLDAEQVRALIADLAAADFARREAATRRLSHFADLIETDLRAALAAGPSPEQTRRLKLLLAEPQTLRDPERVRRWRAVTVLEQIKSPEAQKLLERLAQSPPGSAEGDAAKSALRRIGTLP